MTAEREDHISAFKSGHPFIDSLHDLQISRILGARTVGGHEWLKWYVPCVRGTYPVKVPRIASSRGTPNSSYYTRPLGNFADQESAHFVLLKIILVFMMARTPREDSGKTVVTPPLLKYSFRSISSLFLERDFRSIILLSSLITINMASSTNYDLVVVGSGFAGSLATLSFLEECKKNNKNGRVALVEVGKEGERCGASRWTMAYLRLDKNLDFGISASMSVHIAC